MLDSLAFLHSILISTYSNYHDEIWSDIDSRNLRADFLVIYIILLFITDSNTIIFKEKEMKEKN